MTKLIKMLTLTRPQPKSKKEVMMSILLFATTGLTVSFIKKQTNKKTLLEFKLSVTNGGLVLNSSIEVTMQNYH